MRDNTEIGTHHRRMEYRVNMGMISFTISQDWECTEKVQAVDSHITHNTSPSAANV